MSENEKEDQKELEALNEELARMGVPIEITEKIEWKPGDPVKNIGHAMIAEEHSMSIHAIEGVDGCMSDARYTAPELFKPKEEAVDKDVIQKLKEAFESIGKVTEVVGQLTQVVQNHNDVGMDLSERIDDVANDVAGLKKLADEYLSSNEGYPHRP